MSSGRSQECVQYRVSRKKGKSFREFFFTKNFAFCLLTNDKTSNAELSAPRIPQVLLRN